MEKEIYHGDHPGILDYLEEAQLVASYRIPGHSAEGIEVTLYHVDGVTLKQEVEEDVLQTVSTFTPPDITNVYQMKLTLYSTNNAALGGVEQKILQEIKEIEMKEKEIREKVREMRKQNPAPVV